MTAAARDGRRLALLWLVGMDLRLTILALPPSSRSSMTISA